MVLVAYLIESLSALSFDNSSMIFILFSLVLYNVFVYDLVAGNQRSYFRLGNSER